MFIGSYIWILGPLLALGLKLSVWDSHLKKKKKTSDISPLKTLMTALTPFHILMPMTDAKSDTEN